MFRNLVDAIVEGILSMGESEGADTTEQGGITVTKDEFSDNPQEYLKLSREGTQVVVQDEEGHIQMIIGFDKGVLGKISKTIEPNGSDGGGGENSHTPWLA